MDQKIRLDMFLVEENLVTSREKARMLIQARLVKVNGVVIEKPATIVDVDDKVEIQGKDHPFVSRGGLKLAKAFEVFPLNVENQICVDVGASTGGFTDCLLQHGAQKVYAIDVGYGQLDWSLRQNPRVISMERQNARFMQADWFDVADSITFACMDLAFISIRKILVPLYDCLAPTAQIVALIKPQFEAGREHVGKKGVVRDATVHYNVIIELLSFARDNHYNIQGLDFSPITGPQGNIEFLLWLSKAKESAWGFENDKEYAMNVVKSAQESLLH